MKRVAMIIHLLCFVLLVAGQADKPKQPGSQQPFVLGVTDEIASVVLNEKRIVNIYLPEGYNANDTVTYPVIYLLDGSANEDFIHVAGLVQYGSFPWVNQVPKSILVGIANTDRKRDFTFATSVKEQSKAYPTTGHSDNFIRFIEKELQPFVEKKYHCNASRSIIGQSLGGLLATEILLKQPALFNNYIIISPSLWWDNGSLLQTSPATVAGNAQQTRVYIAVGKEGLTPGPNPRVMEVDANLLADKLRNLKNKSLQLWFDYLPGEDHATIGHQAIYNAFKLLWSSGKQTAVH